MRHPLIPATLLAVGLLLAPVAAAEAAPCNGKFSCAPTEGSDDPIPTQPGLAPEEDTKPLPQPEPTRERETHEAPAPPVQAPPLQAPPVQAPPVQVPQQPAVPQVVTVAPQVADPASNSADPGASAGSASASATPSDTPSATPSGSTGSASASPTVSSNWNTPVGKDKPTQAAAMASSSFSGPNMLGLFGLLGAVLLVGLGGLAFALWSKNRLSSH